MTFWQQLALSITSVLGGGVVSAIVVAHLAARRDRNDYKRKKLEELYELVRTDSVQFFGYWNRYQAAFEGAISLNNAQASVDLLDGPERKAKAEMLVNLYAPGTKTNLSEYYEAKKSFIFVINDMSKSAMASRCTQVSMELFHAARHKFESARQHLFHEIAQQSGKL